jgi:AbrB family looped-hinge helix DNA binding protein
MGTRLTSKGQVTIPKKVREALGLRPGASVDFVLNGDGQFVVQPSRGRRRAVRGRFAALRGVGTLEMTTDEILALTRGDR